MIDTKKLDALLCEHLKIDPVEHRVCAECRHYHGRGTCWCERWDAPSRRYQGRTLTADKCRCRGDGSRPVYPRLSTTGEGMLLLMQALWRARRSWGVEQLPDGLQTWVAANVIDVETARDDEPPMALALAAAQALGIEVPR